MESEKINQELVRKLCSCYLDRCKFKHALAFMQVRRHVPKVNLEQLIEIFNDRKAYIKKILTKVADMIAKGMIDSETPMK
jgi:hypothetical protein